MWVVAWTDGVANDWAEVFENERLCNQFIVDMDAAHGDIIGWLGKWEVKGGPKTQAIALVDGMYADQFDLENKVKEIFDRGL